MNAVVVVVVTARIVTHAAVVVVGAVAAVVDVRDVSGGCRREFLPRQGGYVDKNVVAADIAAAAAAA